MSNLRYLIGIGAVPHPQNGLPARLTIVYMPKLSFAAPDRQDTPHILVETWQDGSSEGPTLPPNEMLNYRPYVRQRSNEYASSKVTYEQESPGWFERKCVEANCSWFFPLTKRLATGEKVPLREIEAAYKTHNDGKEMPRGSLGCSFF
jgi:hypothetical protein